MTLPAVSTATPGPAVAVAGAMLTLSCGSCQFPFAGVQIDGIRRQLSPVARAFPPGMLATMIADYIDAAGVVFVCPRCNAGA